MLRLSIFILSLVTAAAAGAVTLTLDRAPDYALAHNQTLAAAKLRIDEARGRVEIAGTLSAPAALPSKGASGERTEDAPDGYSNDYFLGFRFSLPLPLWNRNEGRIARVRYDAAIGRNTSSGGKAGK